MANSFQPTGVNPSGLTQLIQNLGRDCTPSQFLREFSKNSIEALQRAGGGRLEIDFNPAHRSKGLYKICFIDNGDGMSPQQMVDLLNNLSSSGATNEHQNYGVGAKISALTRNHAGLVYESWRDGQGYMVMLRYNEEQGVYGLQGWSAPDGTTVYAARLQDSPALMKPKIIDQHGTRVTLLGMTDGQDTMLPPEGVGGATESWIILFLNSRFFQIPEGIEILARIGYYRDPDDKKHNHLLRITGQKGILDDKAEQFGDLKVSGAKIYWWIMPKDVSGHGRAFLKGHTALINQGEIFDISDARSSRLAYFGMMFGRDRVVIYVEPENAVQNTARTGLLRPDGSPLNWEAWQDEFRSNMPAPLKEFQDNLINENSKDSHSESIRERLKGLEELFRISRYQKTASGSVVANPDSVVLLGTGHEPSTDTRVQDSKSGAGGRVGSISTSLLAELVAEGFQGVPAIGVSPDPFPKVRWSEETDVLKDRAAEYIFPDNTIVANRDFQGLRDLISYFAKKYQPSPDIQLIIEEEVRIAFEQVLTECVAGALSLKNRPHWNDTEFKQALSPEALTIVVMQRFWMVSSIKRALGNKLKANELPGQQAETLGGM